jgi:hypothetical protein
MAAAFLQARWYRKGGNLPVVRVVIHDEEHPFDDRSAEGVARMFSTSSRAASCHWCVDANSEVGCVHEEDVAYHAPPNAHSVGIERDGYATFTRDQWLSPYGRAAGLRQAQLAAEICVRHKIKPQRLTVAQLRQQGALLEADKPVPYDLTGICAHDDIRVAFGKTTHTDPGPGFPWDEFMACVIDAHRRLTSSTVEEFMPKPVEYSLVRKQGEPAVFVSDGVKLVKGVPTPAIRDLLIYAGLGPVQEVPSDIFDWLAAPK